MRKGSPRALVTTARSLKSSSRTRGSAATTTTTTTTTTATTATTTGRTRTEATTSLKLNRARFGLDMDWYHGLIPRADAEALLQQDGDYLVRQYQPESEKSKASSRQVLTVFWNKQPHHFIINETSTGKGTVYIKTYEFDSVPQMITFYSTKRLAITKKSGAKLSRAIRRAKWELLHEQIKLTKKLGEGAFGGVFKGILRQDAKKIEVAVKQAHLGEQLERQQIEEIMSEARLMRQYEHQNIVTFYGVAAKHEPLLIVMELVKGGGLDAYLQKNGPAITAVKRLHYSKDACAGLEYLHSCNCIHRDIAARNCLLNSQTQLLKISDFGLSRQVKCMKLEKNSKVPLRWVAPEVLTSKSYTQSSDVYSYAILLWEIYMNGAMPFDNLNDKDIAKTIKNGGRLAPPPGMPDYMRTLMTDCWDQTPTQRPTFTQIHTRLQTFINDH